MNPRNAFSAAVLALSTTTLWAQAVEVEDA